MVENSRKYSEGKSKNGFNWTIYNGDANEVLSKEITSNSVDCVVTSPPYYWLRDYGYDGQLGLEGSVDEYVDNILKVMDETLRVLKPSGLLFLNIGDTYYSGKGESQGVDKKSSKRRFGLRAVDRSGGLGIGLKPKTLIGIPWRVATAMIENGWTLRSTIIWYRKHSLPESVKDRPKRSYEFVFMFAKSKKYYYNSEPLKKVEQEDMWTITARPKANGLGTAPYPDELVERCLQIGCPEGGVVMDPFVGSGTSVRVALENDRHAFGIDLSEDFCKYISKKLNTI
ncbi:site-specific DNA-methyltransferase [Dyadobacter sp. CY356]|uniref:DNA-methyltransferase n=1 Tax=Dyadobacter sp. CY356 TaxID=2906442 RepID=UPI001F217F1F|nr:site-specific DNA-methyltransferase [Dyadobacter sp. CY356]MCF0056852.1 site-specific DNA-methyltransferase [Dyadobacter sp. CY356]